MPFVLLFLAFNIQANEPSTKEILKERPLEDENKNSSRSKSIIGNIECEKLPQKTEQHYWNIADCYYKLGSHDKAINILKEVRYKNPKDIEAYFAISWMLWNHGRSLGGSKEVQKNQEALQELERAQLSNPTHWSVNVEIGDFYFLRLDKPEKAYPEYLKARKNYDGDFARRVPKATDGRKSAIEDRIGRVTEILNRKGEAIEASCRSLFFDPDNSGPEKRLTRLQGSCAKKKVKDPRLEKQSEPSKEPTL